MNSISVLSEKSRRITSFSDSSLCSTNNTGEWSKAPRTISQTKSSSPASTSSTALVEPSAIVIKVPGARQVSSLNFNSLANLLARSVQVFIASASPEAYASLTLALILLMRSSV